MKDVDEFTFRSLEEASDPERLVWRTTSRTRAFDTPIFGLNCVHRVSSDGREGDFVEQDCPQWITIVPVFKGSDGIDRFVMERQYRHGVDSVTLEFPAGIVEKGEDAALAASRELLEETGIEAGTITLIGTIDANAAFMNNCISFFLAEDLKVRTALEERNLDENEQIDVVCVPVDYVLSHAGEGEMGNVPSVAGSFFFCREMAGRRK